MCSGAQHVSFSSATALTFANAKIKPLPLLLISDKTPELEALGKKEGSGADSLTIGITMGFISFIRTHVSFSVRAWTPYPHLYAHFFSF